MPDVASLLFDSDAHVVAISRLVAAPILPASEPVSHRLDIRAALTQAPAVLSEADPEGTKLPVRCPVMTSDFTELRTRGCEVISDFTALRTDNCEAIQDFTNVRTGCCKPSSDFTELRTSDCDVRRLGSIVRVLRTAVDEPRSAESLLVSAARALFVAAHVPRYADRELLSAVRGLRSPKMWKNSAARERGTDASLLFTDLR